MILKISAGLNALLFVLSLILGSLYYGSKKDVKFLSEQSERLTQGLTECQESKVKLEASKTVDNTISTEKEEKLQEIDKSTSDTIKKIDDLPSKSTCKPIPIQENTKDEDNEADIDDKLPADLIRLLSESDN